MRALFARALAALVLVALGSPAAAGARGSLLTGFTDIAAYQGSEATRQIALQHTVDARASLVRYSVTWAEIEPQRPPDRATARDPGWLGYRWDHVDAIVRDIAAAGLRPVPTFLVAPRWAEGPNRPRISARAPRGTWRPSPEAFGDFIYAMARRYSGQYPDPQRPGATLPRIRYWQSWNEPDLSTFLSPQWRRHGRGYLPVSPLVYKRLLNSFYNAVKAVDPSNFVVSGGTAPYGDYPAGGPRIPPAAFTRALLCVTGRRHPRPLKRCSGGPAKFDALAQHPYAFGSPGRHAINPDDIVTPDFDKLTRPLHVAQRAGYVLPAGHKQLWATELSYDSDPPDPHALPLQQHARWLEGALYVLWRQGVSVAAWYQLRDSPRGPGYRYSSQSGIYFAGATVAQDRPKPAFTAFRFPFTAYRVRGVARLWGLAPGAGTVSVESRRGRRWTVVKRLRAGSNRLFLGRLRARPGALLRAAFGAERSLTWKVF
jgi:hypothetical protein